MKHQKMNRILAAALSAACLVPFAAMYRHVVITISCDSTKTSILVEAVTSCSVGDQ